MLATLWMPLAGHLNKPVECRNVSSSTGNLFSQPDRELAKTCKFCSDVCTQKSIRDQIIYGLIDGDTVEDLLRDKDLTLEATISQC